MTQMIVMGLIGGCIGYTQARMGYGPSTPHFWVMLLMACAAYLTGVTA